MTTDAPATDTTTDATTTAPEGQADTAAEIAKWKELARKHEDRAKANAGAAKELEQLRQQSMTDQEKAVAQAVANATAETRTAVLREVGSTMVDAEVRAAAAGRSVDVDALLDGLDRGRFIGDDGQPDRKLIGSWIDRVAPSASPPSGFPDLGQGVRGGRAQPSDTQVFADFLAAQRRG